MPQMDPRQMQQAIENQQKEISKLVGQNVALLTLLAALTLEEKPTQDKVIAVSNQLIQFNSDAKSAATAFIKLIEEGRKLLTV